ncbi:AsnC family protein [Salmonella enterica subsp. enterica serovar Durban]|nr:AsnC family protein [Salmonella enterica subsp. enterica serovar Durban]EGQ4787402.1 AsnC family protein [Salmonella enterica subsp. enterica serovar Durban]
MLLKPMGTPGKCPACVRAWTPEENELLIALYPSMTYAEMAGRLGRSTSATMTQAGKLRKAGKLPYKHHYFTPEQDKFIRDNCLTMTIRKVAEVLRKSPYAVVFRAKKMGVSYAKFGDLNPRTKHPDSDVELIRALHDDGISFAEIARKFELHPGTVYSLYHRRLTADYVIAREYLPR